MIVVTGASRGLGFAIAERLINAGHQVLGLSKSGGQVGFPIRKCDVSDYQALREIAQKLRADGVKVAALINAAGVASMNLAVTTPASTTRAIIETNLLGTIFACQTFGPLMMRHKQGNIINFSTIAVSLSLQGESVYVASKAGIEAFTKTFAREVSGFNIQCNCIAPGPIATDLIRGVPQNKIAEIIARQIDPQQFTPDAVCDIVELLLDPRSRALTGEILHIGGA